MDTHTACMARRASKLRCHATVCLPAVCLVQSRSPGPLMFSSLFSQPCNGQVAHWKKQAKSVKINHHLSSNGENIHLPSPPAMSRQQQAHVAYPVPLSSPEYTPPLFTHFYKGMAGGTYRQHGKGGGMVCKGQATGMGEEEQHKVIQKAWAWWHGKAGWAAAAAEGKKAW